MKRNNEGIYFTRNKKLRGQIQEKELVFTLALEKLDDPRSVMIFDIATYGKYRQTVVRKMVQLNWFGKALDLLDENCDGETFELVLLHGLPETEKITKEFTDAFKKMKGLGYKRSILLFQRAINLNMNHEDLLTLFAEMKDECEIAAPPELYNQVFRKCPSLEGCLLVLREARRKGICLNGFSTWQINTLIQENLEVDNAVDLLMEVGKADNIHSSYDIIFDVLLASSSLKRACLSEVLSKWKSLGLDRSTYVFEAEIALSSSPEEAFGLFLKMKDSSAASKSCYQRLLDSCQSFDDATEIVQDAHLKGFWGLCVHEAVGRLLMSASDVPKAVILLSEFEETDIDGVMAEVLSTICDKPLLAAAVFEAVVKENAGVPFPKASRVFFGCDSYVKKLEGVAVPCVLNSFFLLKNPSAETTVAVLELLQKAGKMALALQICHETLHQQ